MDTPTQDTPNFSDHSQQTTEYAPSDRVAAAAVAVQPDDPQADAPALSPVAAPNAPPLPEVAGFGSPASDPADMVAPVATAEEAPATSSANAFAALGLAPMLADTVAALGYETPTDVQSRCIPPLLAGRDLLGQAQTGTGKTAAFALPLLSRLLTAPDDISDDVDTDVLPRVLVIAPTRELALQVAEAFQRYGNQVPNFHVAPIYGGQAYSQQIRSLRRGPTVVVGTPGRVMDHMRRGTLSLAGLRTLVLDEADEMLAMGFADDIDWIFEHTPDSRQVALFSATMPDTIRRVAQKRLRDPVEIRVASANLTVDTIEQHHVMVTRAHKLALLTRLLELEPVDGSVVFVRTRHATAELAELLKAHGFAADALHGDMDQTLRERTIEGLRQGRLDVVVATDVAARGLDVERVTHVINFDIPTDPQAYVHRIGRTGRAGRAGRAILMVEPRERGLLRSIERTIGRSVPQMPVPSAAALTASRIDRFTTELRETLALQDLDFFYQLVSTLTKEQELDLLDVAAALAFQLQKGRPLEVTQELHLPAREARPRPDGRGRRDDERGPRFGDRPGGERPRFGDRPDRDRSGGDRPRFEPRHGDAARPDRFAPNGNRADAPRPDGNRPPRPRQDAAGGDLASYRIEVGRNHGVTPREIVGAIANEAELDGRYIGRIEISDDYSTVDLPAGMPKEVFEHLKRVYVCGQPLDISHAGERPAGGSPYRARRDDDRGERSDRPRSGPGPRPGPRTGPGPRSFEPGNGPPRGDYPRGERSGNRDDGGFRRKRRD